MCSRFGSSVNFEPGFTGIVEIDSAALQVSRDRTVAADVSNVLTRAREKILPHLAENLDAIASAGFTVSKLALLSRFVGYYGKAILFSSKFPWVSLITFPGNVELVDSNSLVQRLSTSDSAYVAYNSGPWTAMKNWEELSPRPNEIGMLVDGEGQRTPSYLSSYEGPKNGSIGELWNDWSDATLFSNLISIIAEVWQTTPKELTKQSSWIHEGGAIRGRFIRA